MVGMNHAKLAVENLLWRTCSVGIAIIDSLCWLSEPFWLWK